MKDHWTLKIEDHTVWVQAGIAYLPSREAYRALVRTHRLGELALLEGQPVLVDDVGMATETRTHHLAAAVAFKPCPQIDFLWPAVEDEEAGSRPGRWRWHRDRGEFVYLPPEED